MRLLPVMIMAMAVCCSTALAADKPQPVKTELLADVSAVQPGMTFNVGVRLTIEEGWHVYWVNPGDAGLPTKVEWKVPDGFKVTAMDFPTPVRFDQPGGIVGYGYHSSLLLIAKVTAPADLKPAKIEIAAKAKWLVCKDVCLPGKMAVTLELPSAGTSTPDNRELFATWLEQVPAAAADVAAVETVAEGETRVIRLTWDDLARGDLQVFVAPGDAWVVKDLTVENKKQKITTIRYTPHQLDKSAGPVEMTVVVAYDDRSGKRRSIKLIEPLGTQSK